MAELSVRVTEKGIEQTERKLKSLGRTGASTEKELGNVDGKSKSLSKSLGKVGGVATATATAIATVTAASIAAASALAKQVVATDNLARVSGLALDQFEATAFAASQYGLSVEKIGDSFKDVSERIGEFIASGSGPLQDFADVLGLTAEETLNFAKEIQGLSGRDALIRLVSELENAGKSTEEISFALEGLSSDLTLLLPLLSNNASELTRLEQALSGLTVPLDEEDIRVFRDLSEAVDLAKGSSQSLLEQAILPLIPSFTELTEAVAQFIASLNEGTEAQLSSELVDLTERSKELEESIKANETAWGRLTNVATFESTDTGFLQAELEQVNAQITETREKLSELRTSTSGLIDTSKPLELAITPKISTPSIDSGLSTGEQNILGVNQEQIDAQVELIRKATLGQEELLAESLERRQELIAQSSLSEEEQTNLLIEVYADYYSELDALSEGSADKRIKEEERVARQKAKIDRQIRKDGLDALGQTTDDLKTAFGEQSAIFKATATTNAIVKTYEAANSAYAALAPIPVVGPGLGAAAAGAAIAAGLANVAKINSARAQGGQVNRGDNVLVGERSPEVFVPNTSGRIMTPQQLSQQKSGASGGDVIINNYSSASVSAQKNENGDVYVRIDELDSLVGGNLSNPNSESYQGLSSTARLERN